MGSVDDCVGITGSSRFSGHGPVVIFGTRRPALLDFIFTTIILTILGIKKRPAANRIV